MIVFFGVEAIRNLETFNSAVVNQEQHHSANHLTGALKRNITAIKHDIAHAKAHNEESKNAELISVIGNTGIIILDAIAFSSESVPKLPAVIMFALIILAGIPYYHYHFVSHNYPDDIVLVKHNQTKLFYKQIMLDNAFEILSICVPSIILASFDYN